MDDIRRCNQDVQAGCNILFSLFCDCFATDLGLFVRIRSLELILANYADPAFSRSNVHSVPTPGDLLHVIKSTNLPLFFWVSCL